MKKFLSFFVMMLAINITLLAQAPKGHIEFESYEHNYGVIKEADGKTTYNFKFKNTGKAPLIIVNAQPSCGCTTPVWKRRPIPPGGSDVLAVTFDPANRPGAFTKSVRVSSNADNNNIMLRIMGEVIGRERTPQELFPRKVGLINMATNYIAFTRVMNTKVVEKSLDFYNFGEKPVALGLARKPSFISVKFEPENVAPGEKGRVIVKYDASKANIFGYDSQRIYLKMNGNEDYNYSIGVSATVVEDFSKLSAKERANAPSIRFDSKEFNFKKIKQGEKAEHVFVIKNKGKSNLLIHKVKASCGCTAVTPDSKMIAPGESTNMKVVFDSHGKHGRQYKTVTIITNDPNQPTSILKVIGEVVSE
ncbi:DUF1573 domain-containing protein [Halosquirtibacter xylanolyticus]|uniref:DUF1573 domain-containing protein n=1 Tax=Halosquirtibacter xylanolyticus TaxID=3374599 RepID=UPI0037480478|nr:DUF1573 domain-containing protein [Prolixibacteraceae bacterium]